MNLPNKLPNTVSAPIVYPKHLSNNWGAYMNANMQHIALKIDQLKIDVADKTKNIEISVARTFDILKDAMNKSAEDYSNTISAGRNNAMLELKNSINVHLNKSVEEMQIFTRNQLEQIEIIKSNLLFAISNIQSNFHLTDGYITGGIDRILKTLDAEAIATASAKAEIAKKVKTVRDLLTEHMNDHNNPHEFDTSKALDDYPVYQADPVASDGIFPMSKDDLIEIPEDEEVANIPIELIDIGGNFELTLGSLSTLHQNSLGKYIVINPIEGFGGTYFRIGHNRDVLNIGLAGDRALQQFGDAAVVTTNGSYPNELILTWTAKPQFNAINDFVILEFLNTNPISGQSVTIKFYPQGGSHDAPIKTVVSTIGIINYTNKSTIFDKIISYAPIGEQIDLSDGFLRLGDLSEDTLIHWSSNNDLIPGTPLKVIQFLNNPHTHDTEEEPSFDLPKYFQRYYQIDQWSDINAVATFISDKNAASWFNPFDNRLYIAFEEDSNRIVHEYALQFPDFNNPMVNLSTVNINHYLVDVVKANNDVSYLPELVMSGTAKIYL